MGGRWGEGEGHTAGCTLRDHPLISEMKVHSHTELHILFTQHRALHLEYLVEERHVGSRKVPPRDPHVPSSARTCG